MRPAQIWALLMLCSFFAFPALSQEVVSSPQSTPQPTDPDSFEGFKSSLQEGFAAVKSSDAQMKSQLLASLSIPDHREWFLKTFGPSEGLHLEAKYVELQSDAPRWLVDRLESVGKDCKIQVTARVYEKPVDPNARLFKAVADFLVVDTPIYFAGTRDVNLGSLVYVAGSFRYLDEQVLRALSIVLPRITLGRNAAAVLLIKKVQPLYPPEARHDHIAGRMSLNVIIGTDGSVQQIVVVSGDPALAQSAVEAVKQWRFKPTLLSGRPVEVMTEIVVTFSLTS